MQLLNVSVYYFPCILLDRYRKSSDDQKTNTTPFLHIIPVHPQGAMASKLEAQGGSQESGKWCMFKVSSLKEAHYPVITRDKSVSAHEGGWREEMSGRMGTRTGPHSRKEATCSRAETSVLDPQAVFLYLRNRVFVWVWKAMVLFFLCFPSIPKLLFLFFKPLKVKWNIEMTILLLTMRIWQSIWKSVSGWTVAVLSLSQSVVFEFDESVTRVFWADVLRSQRSSSEVLFIWLWAHRTIKRSGCSNPWLLDPIKTSQPVVELECPDTVGPVNGPWGNGTKGSQVASH